MGLLLWGWPKAQGITQKVTLWVFARGVKTSTGCEAVGPPHEAGWAVLQLCLIPLSHLLGRAVLLPHTLLGVPHPPSGLEKSHKRCRSSQNWGCCSCSRLKAFVIFSLHIFCKGFISLVIYRPAFALQKFSKCYVRFFYSWYRHRVWTDYSHN